MALLSGLALFACATAGVRQTEEPPYTLVAQFAGVQVRQYVPRIAAETVVDGDEEASRGTGFRRLSDYITGANGGGGRIETLAPAARARDTPGHWRFRLLMPAGSTLASLPPPTDPSVQLVALPAETLAVLRFSGSHDEAEDASHTADLVAALEASAWRPAGAPVAWFYDPPGILPALRRNEVAIPVSPK